MLKKEVAYRLTIERSQNAMRKNPKVLFIYAPAQNLPGTVCKPQGALAHLYNAGTLLRAGVEVDIFDACVGRPKRDDLQQTFYRSTELPSGLLRTGVPVERILEEAADSDVIGFTSIFSNQERMVLATIHLIKKTFPDKLVITGGVNARSRMNKFFDAGVDAVFLSESEKILPLLMAEAVRQRRRKRFDFTGISALASRASDGTIVINRAQSIDFCWNLDELPMPAWHLHPNDRYAEIARPHGGDHAPGQLLRYASMMTSRGCPFNCAFCHIAGEIKTSLAGEIGRFRYKTIDRVLQEVEILKGLGIETIYLEDDSLLAIKSRAFELLRSLLKASVRFADVNGVNAIHMLNKDGSPAHDVIELLKEARINPIVLAFESGDTKIIDEYVSNKWNPQRHDMTALIRACKAAGLYVGANYMLGFPTETRTQMEKTIRMAREHKEAGADHCNFFAVMPCPGTPLFERSLACGYIRPDFDPDYLNWTQSIFINTPVSANEIEEVRQRAWEEINGEPWKESKRAMVPKA